MSGTQFRFEDGAAYERTMSAWSQLLGAEFLDWLAPAPGRRWIDVGCGNGAFTELLAKRCAPSALFGIDPSEAQVAYARARPGVDGAEFRVGDAMALPFPADHFDAAVMALVIFFVPEPPKGVAEMARVTRPGGSVSAYAWDIPGGGMVFEPVLEEMRAMGRDPPGPPNADAASIDALRGLWSGAGLVAVETRAIPVRQTFASFDAFWSTTPIGTGLSPAAKALPAEEIEELKRRVRGRLGSDAAGRVECRGWANAVKGLVPG